MSQNAFAQAQANSTSTAQAYGPPPPYASSSIPVPTPTAAQSAAVIHNHIQSAHITMAGNTHHTKTPTHSEQHRIEQYKIDHQILDPTTGLPAYTKDVYGYNEFFDPPVLPEGRLLTRPDVPPAMMRSRRERHIDMIKACHDELNVAIEFSVGRANDRYTRDLLQNIRRYLGEVNMQAWDQVEEFGMNTVRQIPEEEAREKFRVLARNHSDRRGDWANPDQLQPSREQTCHTHSKLLDQKICLCGIPPIFQNWKDKEVQQEKAAYKKQIDAYKKQLDADVEKRVNMGIAAGVKQELNRIEEMKARERSMAQQARPAPPQLYPTMPQQIMGGAVQNPRYGSPMPPQMRDSPIPPSPHHMPPPVGSQQASTPRANGPPIRPPMPQPSQQQPMTPMGSQHNQYAPSFAPPQSKVHYYPQPNQASPTPSNATMHSQNPQSAARNALPQIPAPQIASNMHNGISQVAHQQNKIAGNQRKQFIDITDDDESSAGQIAPPAKKQKIESSPAHSIGSQPVNSSAIKQAGILPSPMPQFQPMSNGTPAIPPVPSVAAPVSQDRSTILKPQDTTISATPPAIPVSTPQQISAVSKQTTPSPATTQSSPKSAPNPPIDTGLRLVLHFTDGSSLTSPWRLYSNGFAKVMVGGVEKMMGGRELFEHAALNAKKKGSKEVDVFTCRKEAMKAYGAWKAAWEKKDQEGQGKDS